MTVNSADWSHVTLGEYAALDIIRRDDAERWMNRYWDQLHANHMVIAGTDATEPDVPGRLTDDGRAWLADLHDTVVTTLDDHKVIAAARAFLNAMGTLLTMNVARAIRDDRGLK